MASAEKVLGAGGGCGCWLVVLCEQSVKGLRRAEDASGILANERCCLLEMLGRRHAVALECTLENNTLESSLIAAFPGVVPECKTVARLVVQT